MRQIRALSGQFAVLAGSAVCLCLCFAVLRFVLGFCLVRRLVFACGAFCLCFLLISPARCGWRTLHIKNAGCPAVCNHQKNKDLSATLCGARCPLTLYLAASFETKNGVAPRSWSVYCLHAVINAYIVQIYEYF